ncbi:MAG: glycosyltransferase, partial [Betaproteobacteria bacterium]
LPPPERVPTKNGYLPRVPAFPSSSPPAPSRIAVVHDWLDTWRGGENVLAEVLSLFPEADLFALVNFLPDASRRHLLGKRAHATYLQRIPGARCHFRKLLPLFPHAIGTLDLSDYPLVISISHAVAKGVRTTARQLHLCYCLTPMRYAWDLRPAYLESIDARTGWRRSLAEALLDRLQRWDLATSRSVSEFIAISDHIRDRIGRCYGRESAVIYPPVDVDFFTPPKPDRATGALYVTASRWVPYKRIDLIVEAFRALPDRQLRVAGDGPDARRIRAAAGPNIEFVGELDRTALRELLRNARAFLFAADEDFGILPVEAQACGTPVIAFGRGGTLETVRGPGQAGPTGVFFETQSAAAITDAVKRFEAGPPIPASACRSQAERFSAARFRATFETHIQGAWESFVTGGG